MKKLKVGVIGIGEISKIHIPHILNYKNVEIVGLYDVRVDRAVEMSQKYQVPYVNTYQELIEMNPDVVHVLTPHDTHYGIIKDLISHHIHILAEKPLTIDYRKAIELVDLASEHEVILAVCLQNRTNKTTKKLLSVIQDKAYGKLLSVRGNVFWKRELSYYQKDSWRGTWRHEGGGVLINQAIHTLDLLTLIGGDIESFYGSYANYLMPDIEVEDQAHITLLFKNQARGFFSATTSNTVDSPVEIDVVMEKARFKLLGDTLYQLIDQGFQVIEKDESLQGEKFYFGVSHEKVIHDLYDHLLYHYGDVIHAKDTLTCLEIITKVYEQKNGQQPMKIDHHQKRK